MYEFLYELTNTEFDEIKKLYQFNRIHINNIELEFYKIYLFDENLTKINFIYNKETNFYTIYQNCKSLNIYVYNILKDNFTKINKSNFILTADLSSKILNLNTQDIIYMFVANDEYPYEDYLFYDYIKIMKNNNINLLLNNYKSSNVKYLLNDKQLYLEYFIIEEDLNKLNNNNLQNLYMLIYLNIKLPKLQNIEIQYIKKQLNKIIIKLTKKFNKQKKRKLYIVQPTVYESYSNEIIFKYKLFVNLKEISELIKFVLYANIVDKL